MKNSTKDLPFDLQYIRKHYFSDPECCIVCNAGEIIMRQDGYNDRLFLLEKGQLEGYHELEGERIKLFMVEPDMFVGVHSFFSGTFQSGATVITRKPSVLSYIGFSTMKNTDPDSQFYKDFMPVVVHELFTRTLNLQQAALEKRETLKRLLHNKKLASLGQMASGIAHELNNALAVIMRNTDWLCEHFFRIVPFRDEEEKDLLTLALQNGRSLSTRDTRTLYRDMETSSAYDRKSIQKLSEMNLSKALYAEKKFTPDYLETLYHKWQIATTLHDMAVSANQATQVIKSMHILGSEPRKKTEKISITSTLKEALTLVSPQCRGIDIQMDIDIDANIRAHPSELVQIWTNLLTNACQSLRQSQIEKPVISIQSRKQNSELLVEISDNGPGIPENLLHHIFEPHVTTKIDGLSFGLGLGLSIVEKLVSYYNGSISVKSNPGKTTFSVKITL